MNSGSVLLQHVEQDTVPADIAYEVSDSLSGGKRRWRQLMGSVILAETPDDCSSRVAYRLGSSGRLCTVCACDYLSAVLDTGVTQFYRFVLH